MDTFGKKNFTIWNQIELQSTFVVLFGAIESVIFRRATPQHSPQRKVKMDVEDAFRRWDEDEEEKSSSLPSSGKSTVDDLTLEVLVEPLPQLWREVALFRTNRFIVLSSAGLHSLELVQENSREVVASFPSLESMINKTRFHNGVSVTVRQKNLAMLVVFNVSPKRRNRHAEIEIPTSKAYFWRISEKIRTKSFFVLSKYRGGAKKAKERFFSLGKHLKEFEAAFADEGAESAGFEKSFEELRDCSGSLKRPRDEEDDLAEIYRLLKRFRRDQLPRVLELLQNMIE